MAVEEERYWWILQVQFQERHPGQLNLISEPLPRDKLFRECLRLIPANIRVEKGPQTWGLANLTEVDPNTFSANLFVRPPFSRIAQEPKQGFLEKTDEPRYFTPIYADIPSQIIAIHRASEVTRHSRTAKSISKIIYDLLKEATNRLGMSQFYEIDVEPLAKTGSFVQWYKSLEHLDKIIIHYVGPNLPSRPDSLVEAIKDTAKKFKETLNSETVDLVSNDPDLKEEDVVDLDKAVSERRLRFRAKGNRKGLRTTWSSSTRPEAETLPILMSEEEISDLRIVAAKLRNIFESYFDEENQ